MSRAAARRLLDDAAPLLAAAGIADARRESRLLLAAAMGLDQGALLTAPDRPVAAGEAARFLSYVERRTRREPVSRILGRREFWSLPFRVTPATLDPRPDSETLVEAALGAVSDRGAGLRVLDLGTGTGCLLLAILAELGGATGIGVDLDPAAIATAEDNARDLGLSDRARFRVGDWLAGLDESFDLIVSNPPYIPAGEIDRLEPEVALWDPRRALGGGDDGLDSYRNLAPQIALGLKPGGVAVLELGAGQAEAVERILAASGLEILGFRHDLGSIVRCILAMRRSEKTVGMACHPD